MKKLVLALSVSVFFTACNKNDSNPVTPITPLPFSDTASMAVVANYADIVYASYGDALSGVTTLQSAVTQFTQNPTAGGLEACKAAWKAARITYGQTEAYRFYDGPIEEVEGFINAWPLDESFVDYTVDDSTSGIVNNPVLYPNIDKATLQAANEAGSETNVATGYHAIEFLLWGQDLSASGPGARPFTDYVAGQGRNAARRAQYLNEVVKLLADDVASVYDAWRPGAPYRVKFTSATEVAASLTKIIQGLGSLSKGELAGERMAVALTNEDQEDEHSCFSDNTHIDIQMNFTGIENVYKGQYTRPNGNVIKGRSLSDIIGAKDAAKNKLVLNQLAQTRASIFAIPAPFDQAIINSKDKVTAGITDLRKLSDYVADAAFAIGIKLSF